MIKSMTLTDTPSGVDEAMIKADVEVFFKNLGQEVSITSVVIDVPQHAAVVEYEERAVVTPTVMSASMSDSDLRLLAYQRLVDSKSGVNMKPPK